MRSPFSHVLVLGSPADDLQGLLAALRRFQCSTDVVVSADQILSRAQHTPAHLVILAGSHHDWLASSLITELRKLGHMRRATIVALTDCHAPSWMPLEDNPGLDGFLVKPLNSDVLHSLVQSAWVRQTCCA